MLRSASARPTSTLLLCLDCQRRDVQLPHFRFDCQRSEVPLPLCLYCQRSEVPRPHFRSALTAKDVKFRIRTSALPWLAKIWNSAFRTCSARTSKNVKFRFCISSVPGLQKILQFHFCTFAQSRLPKIWRSASPLTLCLYCQIWEVSPPHFPSALTAKDLYFHISDLPSFPKMWTHFCSALTAKGLPPQFRCRFILCISTQFRAVLHEGLALQRDEASLFAGKNQNHLIHT